MHILVILALRKPSREDYLVFEALLDYIVNFKPAKLA